MVCTTSFSFGVCSLCQIAKAFQNRVARRPWLWEPRQSLYRPIGPQQAEARVPKDNAAKSRQAPVTKLSELAIRPEWAESFNAGATKSPGRRVPTLPTARMGRQCNGFAQRAAHLGYAHCVKPPDFADQSCPQTVALGATAIIISALRALAGRGPSPEGQRCEE